MRPARAGKPRLLVSLGATDPAGVIPVVLSGLHGLGRDADVDVVLGSAAPHRAAIADKIQRMSGQVVLHLDPPDPSALVEAADLAIGAGGVSCLERCCLGVPSLLIVVAENQRDNVAALVQLGAGISIGTAAEITAEAVACAVRMALDSDLAAKSRAAAQVCDGHGAMRAAEAIASVAGVNS
jgi:spore coat polysaccharide biosynthesis predicted glycosyltransferase SpsG